MGARAEVHGPGSVSVAEQIRLAALLGDGVRSPSGAERSALRGWTAVDLNGHVQGFIVDDDERPGVGREGEWVATSPAVLAALYTAAAAEWTRRSIWTHTTVLRRNDPLEGTLLSLGFGHEQAYGELQVAHVDRPATVRVRLLSTEEHDRVLPLVGVIAESQAGSPAFAPRTAEFLDALDSSFLEWASRDVVVFCCFDSTGRDPVGFLAVDGSEDVPEITLAAVAPTARGQGIGSSLLSAARGWALTAGIPTLQVDWRTTNPLADAFWSSAGVETTAYRWSRTIDARPS